MFGLLLPVYVDLYIIYYYFINKIVLFCLSMCVLVSVISGIPLFCECVTFHSEVVVFHPPEIIIFSHLDSRLFLQVCMTANIRADVGGDIIHVYVRLPFDMIPTSMKIAYIHTNGELQTIASIQSARRSLNFLGCGARDDYHKGEAR